MYYPERSKIPNMMPLKKRLDKYLRCYRWNFLITKKGQTE